MAFLTAEKISALAIELLTRTLVLPMSVTRVPGVDFGGPSGGTVNVRVPQPREAQEQTTPGDPISFVSIEETSVPVTVKHLFDAALITDEDLTLSIEMFGRQVSAPQVAAVATGAEDQVSGAMNALTADAEIEFPLDPDPAADEAVVLAARERLTSNDVPLGNRFMAVAPDIATRLLAIEKFVKLNESGTPSALRDAVLAKHYGFTFLETNAIDAGSAVAYHQSGFVWTSMPPAAPNGAADSARATLQGISLRQLFQYVPDRLSDASIVSTFSGASVVTEDDEGTEIVRALKIGTAIA
jgi:hypothetical protein